MGKRVLIVGGDAAGMSAASQVRRANPGLEVLVLERGEHVSYGACGIPYYVSGEISSSDALVALTPEALTRRGIEVCLGHEVTEVRPGARQVTARTVDGRQLSLRYDWLVLATGAEPVRPAWPGAELSGVVCLRRLGEGIALRRWVDEASGSRAAVIGTGLLGLEMAEALARRGVHTTLVGRAGQLLSTFAPEAVAPIAAALQAVGVELALGREVTGYTGASGRVKAVTTTVDEIPADLVLLALGVRPAAGLAREAGIGLGRTGAIAVSERMKTDAAGVYAAGDCAEVIHVVTGERVFSPLALTANRTGRIAGDNLASESLGRVSGQRFRGTAGSTVAQVAGFTVASTGLTPDQAKAAGFEVAVFSREGRSRAAYYPGGTPLHTRIAVDRRTRRLLGAQMVGQEGVAGRIDVFAAALFGRMTVDDVYHLDLAYSPPFGPVYDPVIEICGRAGLEL